MKERVNKTFMLSILGILILTFLIISKNLDQPYLGFDEAFQFWDSKGLNPDSNPTADKNGGLAEVIENNKYYNMDPGGFTILLHFWTFVSNHHLWLRLFPFLFFTGVILTFIYLSYVWLNNLSIALIMGFVPILTPVVILMGTEVRAYGMECLGTVISIVALQKLKDKLTNKHLFLWSCIFSFFITSRYAEIVVIFIVSLYVLFLIFNSGISLKQKLVSAIIYSLPLLATCCYIYFFALSFQNKSLEPLAYLKYISKDKGILIEPKNFLFLCTIGLLTVLFFLRNRYSIIKKYEILLFVTISVNIAFLILSFLGKHPWDPYNNRCISMFLLVVLCMAAFIGELLKLLFESPGILKYSFVASLLVLILFARKDKLFIRLRQNNTYFNFVKTDISNYKTIYADRWVAPCIRYLFEYGSLKDKKGDAYPSRFTFAHYTHHSFEEGKMTEREYYLKGPKMNDLLEYDLLITPELFLYGRNDKWKRIEGTSNFYIKNTGVEVQN